MRFLLCFCLKRNRAASNISSRKVSYTNSNSTVSTVTSPPLPVSSDMPVETNYARIIDSSDDQEIGINNEQPASITSVECDGYAKITPVRALQLSFDDSELYATVDKTRKAKNAIRRKTDATNTIDAAPLQGSLSAPVTASSSHPSNLTIVSEHSPVPFPVYTNINESHNHDNTSSGHRSDYENIETRDSLQYCNHHSEMKEEEQLHSYSQSSNGSEIDDDSSERYATIINVNNTEEQSTTNPIFQDIVSVML